MDFALTAEQKQIREMVSEFVDEGVKPRVAEIDETDKFPADLMAEMGQLGLMDVPFPEEYGGVGLDYHSYAIGLEEISHGFGGLGTIIAAYTSLAGNMFYEFGNEEQKQTYLTPLNEGTDTDVFALSEPGVGSGAPAMETTAVKNDDEYVVDGERLWISNGSIADMVVVFAKTGPDAGNKGISSSVIRPEVDGGFVVESTEYKLGDKGCPTAELRLNNMRIPEDQLLGGEGDSFVQALKTLNGDRVTIAARSVSITRATLDDVVTYVGEREQFDQPIGDFRAIKHELVDVDTKVQATTPLMREAANLKMRGETFIKEAAQAKLYASKVDRKVASGGVQIRGGYGYTKNFAAERYYRDAKLSGIYEGTSEILRGTIGD